MTTPKEYHNIQLKNITLTYLLERKPVKNINLRIKSDGSVCVSANNRVPVWRIEEFIIEKQDYIERAIREYSKKNTQELASKQYVDGETFGFLGKSLCLKVKEAETVSEDHHSQHDIPLGFVPARKGKDHLKCMAHCYAEGVY